jgi:hypothetical protein
MTMFRGKLNIWKSSLRAHKPNPDNSRSLSEGIFASQLPIYLSSHLWLPGDFSITPVLTSSADFAL